MLRRSCLLPGRHGQTETSSSHPFVRSGHVRVQVAHFLAEDLERVFADREVVRPAEREAPLGAERELRRLRPTLGPRRPGGSAPHRGPDHPAGRPQPEPGTRSRWVGMVVSA